MLPDHNYCVLAVRKQDAQHIFAGHAQHYCSPESLCMLIPRVPVKSLRT